MLAAMLVIAPPASANHHPLPQRCTGDSSFQERRLFKYSTVSDGRTVQLSGIIREQVCTGFLSPTIVRPTRFIWCYVIARGPDRDDLPPADLVEFRFNTFVHDANEGIAPDTHVLTSEFTRRALCEFQYIPAHEQKWLERNQGARWDAFATVVHDTSEKTVKLFRGRSLL